MTLDKTVDIPVELKQEVTKVAETNKTFFSQDKNTAVIEFNITEDGIPVDFVKRPMTAKVAIRTNDNSTFYEDAVVSTTEPGYVSYTVNNEALMHEGKASGELFLIENDESASIIRFEFNIKLSIIDSKVDVIETFYVKRFDELLQQLEAKVDGTGSTGSGEIPAEYITETELSAKGYATQTALDDHIKNTGIHVTSSEKTTWNNKLDSSTADTKYEVKGAAYTKSESDAKYALKSGTSTGTTQDLSAYQKTADADAKYALKTHAHAISDVTNLQSTLDAKSSTSHTHTAAQIMTSDGTTSVQAKLDSLSGSSGGTSSSGGTVTAPTWTTVTLSNGYTGTVKWAKDGFNMVSIIIDVTVGTGALNTVVASLPASIIPAMAYLPGMFYNSSTGGAGPFFNVGNVFNGITSGQTLTNGHNIRGQLVYRV